MRRAARTDSNHAEIKSALRQLGCAVFDTSKVGEGFPDLAVSLNGWTALLEIKDGSKPPSERKLTPAQERFRATWKGAYFVVTSVDEAIAAVTAARAA